MNTKQKEELAKYCFDISKLFIASLIFPLFGGQVDIPQITFGIFGLTMSMICLRLGIQLLKE